MADPLLSLATLAGRRRKEAQAALVEQVAGLLDAAGNRSERELALIDDIITDLLPDVETLVRAQLAGRLAKLDTPPRGLLNKLLEDEASVAESILLRSPALGQTDLIGACGRSHGHRMAVAARPNINEEIGDLLIVHDEPDVTLTLLQNKAAALSQKAYARIVARLAQEPGIAEALKARPDLSPALAHSLFWKAAGKLRGEILKDFAILPEAVDGIVGDLEAAGCADLTRAFDTAAGGPGRDRMARYRPASTLIGHLRAGDLPAFAQAAGERLEVAPDTMRRILADAGGEALAVACKALDLDRTQFTSLYLLLDYRRTGKSQPAGAIEPVAALFSDLRQGESLAALRLWDRVDVSKAA